MVISDSVNPANSPSVIPNNDSVTTKTERSPDPNCLPTRAITPTESAPPNIDMNKKGKPSLKISFASLSHLEILINLRIPLPSTRGRHHKAVRQQSSPLYCSRSSSSSSSLASFPPPAGRLVNVKSSSLSTSTTGVTLRSTGIPRYACCVSFPIPTMVGADCAPNVLMDRSSAIANPANEELSRSSNSAASVPARRISSVRTCFFRFCRMSL
mmetsp:Transcript_9195/g.19803  ORF Transcript_9195/g.19803 Transcript_9195/m.19803 type:complete len:212 (-) Transcript_9195:1878-2513(-)